MAHKLYSPWFTQIAEWTFQEFETREAALAAEKAAIETERPPYNRTWSDEKSEKTKRLNMVVPESLVKKIDGWRSEQPRVPNMSEAIRRLVDLGMAS